MRPRLCHRASAATGFSCILCRMGFNRMTGLWAAATIVAVTALVTAHAQQAPQGPPQAQANQPATAFLGGQVVEYPSGKPVAGATVTLLGRTDPRGPRSPVLTDAQGRFYFANLLPGSFQTQVVKVGYAYPQMAFVTRSVDLAVGERVTDLKVSIAKLGSISGILRDDAGDPVVGMLVSALRRGVVNGRAIMQPAGVIKSDDRGMYRIASLQPGDYIVCACVNEPMPLDGILLSTLASQPLQLMSVTARALRVGGDVVSMDDSLRTFAPTMYPMSSTVARALRVPVKPGEESGAIDITLTATRSRRISGRIVGAAGITANSIRLAVAGESDEGASLTQLTPMLVQPDGRFEFINVPSGNYVLTVNQVTGVGPVSASTYSGMATAFIGGRSGAAVPSAPPEQPIRVGDLSIVWASVPVTVGSNDVLDLQVAPRPGQTLSGTLRFDGEVPLPAVVTRGSAAVRPLVASSGPAIPTFNAQAKPDGSLRLSFGLPGRHALDVQMPGFSMKRVELGGVDVTDLPLELSGDTTDLVITLASLTRSPMASIQGTVTQTGSARDVTALIFAADRRFWSEPRAANRRFQAVAVSRKGTFAVSNLAAGDYFLAVVPDTETVDWIEASRLEALSRSAQKLTIVDGEKKIVEVKR